MKKKEALEYLIMTVLVASAICLVLVKGAVLEGFKNVRLRNS